MSDRIKNVFKYIRYFLYKTLSESEFKKALEIIKLAK